MKLRALRLLLVLCTAWLFCHAFFFVFHPVGPAFRTLSRILVVPAAMTDDIWIPYARVAEAANGIRVLQNDMNKRQALREGLAFVVEDGYVRSLAKRYGVSQGDAWKTSQLDPSLEETLTKGDWDTESYRAIVVKALDLRVQVDGAVRADQEEQVNGKLKAQAIMEKLNNGMPFAEAAVIFSEDVTGAQNGDLGTVILDELPDWLAPVKDLERGDIELVENKDAFWIVTVSERGGTDGEAYLRLRGIATKKRTVNEVVSEMRKASPAWVFLW